MLKKLLDPSRKLLKKGIKIAKDVFALEDEFKKLKDEDFPIKTQEFRKRAKSGEDLEKLMPEAFALVREASVRVLGLTPYFVQVQGAYIIHGGNIAEMKTGEGKTLTAVMPAYLNALLEEGVHIVTVNEYLAKREAEGEIGQLFRFLGLTVGLNIRDYSSEEKRQAYDCDILYSTNSELGFDYLRDHMVLYKEDLVNQRGLNYAIIDEVDSILIDEARTPLIISGGSKNTHDLYTPADRFAKSLLDEDFEIDVEDKTIELLPSGIKKAEQAFKLENLYDLDNVSLLHRINNALRANYLMFNDKEYVVDNNEVLIVDQFTGRILKGRQFSEGLHQALEAKENVTIKEETVTVATITYQNFFRMYKKLAGMTGTAKTEEEEFRDIYNMLVAEVPTNAPVIRDDAVDYIFASNEDKLFHLINEVEERHTKGQPILLGTIAVETSELLSSMLRKRRIPHEVLNAKNHEREAEIIAKAGQIGSVTIATNMAGRGTDIKLGQGVVALGGLAVLGSERHEARRIDNQLRGRSGRQGDPGYSRFYLSAEDELLIRFGGDRFKQRIELLEKLNKDSDSPISSKMFSKFVTGAQKRIEGYNYDSRKNVLKYDDVIRQHREIIYAERTKVLKQKSVEEDVLKMIKQYFEDLVLDKISNNKKGIKDELKQLYKELNGNIFNENTLNYEEFTNCVDQDQIFIHLQEQSQKEIKNKRDNVPEEVYLEFLKVVMLRVIDTYWMEHIDTMDALRQSVSLEAYRQTNPLITYQQEGFELFNKMLYKISEDVTRYVIRAVIQYNAQREEVVKNTATNDGEEVNSNRRQRRSKNKSKKPWNR